MARSSHSPDTDTTLTSSSTSSLLPSSSSPSSARHPDKVANVFQVYGLRSLLIFFSHRVLRVGPRLLLYLALFSGAVFLVAKVLPLGLTDMTVERTLRLLPGTKGGKPTAWSGTNNEEDALVGGGLRIVVFGENDVATTQLQSMSGGLDLGENNGTTWTQELCSELKCSTYLSYVPQLSYPPRSIESHKIFSELTDTALALSKDKPPARDFSYVVKDYGIDQHIPDLEAQISAFLHHEPPQRPPKETVFIFSFGMWDIWSLASYPELQAESAISSIVADIFLQVETLVMAAEDSTSMAYSHYQAVPTNRDDGVPKQQPVALPWEHGSTQPFRIIVPLLLDPSVVPGWHLERPQSPARHLKSEQVRRAAKLTLLWNEAVEFQMETWMHTGEVKQPEEKPQPPPASIPNISTKRKRDAKAGADEPDYEYLQQKREGIVLRVMTDYLTDMMIEGQMQARKWKDKKGSGGLPKEDVFRDVQTPCISVRDLESKASQAAQEALNETQGSQGSQDSQDTGGPSGARRALSFLLNHGKIDRVCDSPNDHFFFTPFSLGRRGIHELGRLAAVTLSASREKKEQWKTDLEKVQPYNRKTGMWKDYLMP